nr:UDP-glucuronosyltransferase 2A3-like [Nothobranchius furzeri]
MRKQAARSEKNKHHPPRRMPNCAVYFYVFIPLQDIEEFVQSSGDDGIVVFSLGAVVKNLTTDKANLIASGLAQVPQKVLWKYSGNTPETLGSNTKLYSWIPQNDLLGAVSRLTDKINFSERTWNVLFYVLQDLVLDQCMWKKEHPPVPVR